MLDELAIYNLSVKYPNTVDLVREVERIARVEAIDDYNRELKEYLRRSDVHYVSDNVFNYFAERLKEQNIK